MAERTKLDLYYQYSEKAGDIARNLGFIGFAIIWLFKIDWGGRPNLPNHLGLAALLLIIGLAIDLIHYFSKAIYWGFWASDTTSADQDAKRVNKIGTATILFQFSKFVFIFGGYVVLGIYLNTHVGAFKTDDPHLPPSTMSTIPPDNQGRTELHR